MHRVALLYNFYRIMESSLSQLGNSSAGQHFAEKHNRLEKYLELMTIFRPRQGAIVLRDKQTANALKKSLLTGPDSLGPAADVDAGASTPRNSKASKGRSTSKDSTKTLTPFT